MKKFYKYLVIFIIISVLFFNCHKNSWPLTPSPPSGPSLGTINDTLLFRVSTTDPDGDDIAYQFDWGTENNSDWSDFFDSGDSITVTHSWNDTGHYNIRVRAMDIKDKVSRWADPHLLVIVISIAPNIPSIFSGPDSGYINYSYTFSTTTTDPDGDSISYQFDWGDDNLSNWSSYAPNGDSVSMDHSWSSEGTYEVKVKAKDKYGLESGWSPEHSIIISIVPNLPPYIPDIPSGPSSGYKDSTYSFSISTTDPDGDSIAYQFDWGDGNYSGWSNYVSNGQSVSMDHSYSFEGTHYVKAKAKDKNEAESGWSYEHQIIISSIKPPNIPSAPSGPDVGYVDNSNTFSVSTTDPDGDSVSYQLSWGDGDTTNWSDYLPSGQSISMTHSYSSGETYSVKVRAKDKRGMESGWSDRHQIEIKKLENWSFPTGGSSSPALKGVGTIYVVVGDELTLYWQGKEIASFSTGFTVSSSPAIGSDGTIYVGSLYKKLYAINSGMHEKWIFSTRSWVESSPAIGSDGTIYVGSYDSTLYAIDTSGNEKWSFSTKGMIHSSPAVGTDGTIYVGSYGGLYAVDSAGNEKWSFSTGSWMRSSPAIGSDGTIYVGSNDNNLYAINSNGTEKWRFLTEGEVYSSPAIGSDGTIYVGSWDNNLYAINPNGTEKWRFSTGGDVESSPAISSDGTIFVGSKDDNLYAINSDGTEKWRFSTGGDVCSSPAIGGGDHIIYISCNGGFYAINGYSGGPADTPWPMFHHDLRHTGRARNP